MFRFKKKMNELFELCPHTRTHRAACTHVCVCVYISTHPCDDVHIKRLEKLIESFNGGDLLPAILASDHSYTYVCQYFYSYN